MKASPMYNSFFSIILLSTFFFFYVDSQSSDSCNSPLNLQTQLPFDTSSLHCVEVWSAKGFILRYEQAAPNVWSFVLSAPSTNSYIGMGFSPNGNMVGSRAIVGWIGADGTSNMKKYYLGGQAPNLVTLEDSLNQGLQMTNASTIIPQSNRTYIAFQLATAKPSMRLLYAIGPDGQLPSSPNYTLVEHQDRISTSLNYATGQFQSQKTPEASLRRSHGILNMLGWGIMMPVGAMVARYMRQWDPLWFYSHTIIQSLGFILGVIGIVCGFILQNRLKASVNKHKGIGIFILTLGCLQVIAFLARPDTASKVRKYWNWYHYIVGRVLIFFAAVNVFYGIHLGEAGTEWNVSFAIVLVILFIVTLILELRTCMRK